MAGITQFNFRSASKVGNIHADLRYIAPFVLVEVDVYVISRAVESSVRVSDASAEARPSDLIALQRQTRRYDEPVPVTLIALARDWQYDLRRCGEVRLTNLATENVPVAITRLQIVCATRPGWLPVRLTDRAA